MKLFLTGGTGFFGKAILRHLQLLRQIQTPGHLQDQVVVLSRSPEDFLSRHPEFAEHNWLRFHRGDIGQASSLPQNEQFTHVLHAAADSTDAAQLTDLQRFDQIVNGTRNMLDFTVATGAQRFLITSSGAVYGPQPTHLELIPEDWLGIPDPLVCANAYGIAKRAAEHLCALYGQVHGLHTVIARCFAFVGPDLPLGAHFAIGNFIRDAISRPEIIVGGDGTPLRSYLDQQDLARWLMMLMEHGQFGTAYNVGSDQAVSIADLAYLVRDIVAPGKPVRIMGSANTMVDRNRYIPDIRKVCENFQLDVDIPLADAIGGTAEAVIKAGNLVRY